MNKINQYEILETIGSGGMGIVYRAFDTVLERVVAIKVMHAHLLAQKENAERLMNEARAAAKLTHPHIVTIYEVGEASCGKYIVMEFVEGNSLSQVLLTNGALPTDQAIGITTQILGALALAHKNDIQHRDIKPDNVLVTADFDAKILDFGIAKLNTQKGITAAGDILGTVDYMASEQLMGDPVDHRADLYSTGVMLYELLTKHLPFGAETPVAVLYKQLNEDPLPPSYYSKSISKKLDALILRSLAKNANDRWDSAEEFANALMAVNIEVPLPSASRIEGIDAHLDALFSINENEDRNAELERGMREIFIGREKELKKLAQLFLQTQSGKGNTVVLLGEAGVGKSSIASQLEEYARKNQALCLYGASLYQDGMDAYLPFIDALRKYVSTDLRLLPEEQRMTLKSLIRTKVPLLMEYTERFNTTFSGATEPLGDENSAKGADLFEGILVLVSLLATMQPVVFILDDLQWADDASLKLFHYLARQIEKSRILLIGISRTDRYDLLKDGKAAKIVDVLARMSREGISEEVKISRFDRDRCDQLIDLSLENTIFSEDFYEKIYQETRGNAFFVIETLKYLQETDKIYFEEDAWYDRSGEIDRISVPNRIEDIFSRRLQAIDEEKREILQVAAIVGYKVDVSILAELLEEPKIKLLKKLHALNGELNLLLSTDDGFQFEHPMLRDMLYEEVPIALRREYHLLIAQILEKMHGPQYGARIGEVAEHFKLSGRHLEAIPLLYRAANRALKLNAYRESSAFLEDISACLEKGDLSLPEDIPEKDFLLKSAICYEEMMRYDASQEKYKDLLSLSKKQNDFGGQVDALRRMGRVQEKLTNYDLALEYLQQCLDILENHPIENSLSRVYNSLGIIYMQKGEYDIALKNFEETKKVVDHHFGEYDRAHALTNIGIINSIRGNYETAIDQYKKAIAIYDELDESLGKARALHNIGMAYSDIENWDASIAAFDVCYKIVEKLKDSQLGGLTLLNMAKAYIRQDDTKNSFDLIERALKIFRRSGHMLNIAECYLVLGLISQKTEDYPAAEKYFQDSIKINTQKGDHEALLEVCQAFGEYYAEREEFEKAYRQLNQALESAQTLDLSDKSRQLLDHLKEVEKHIDSEVKVVPTEHVSLLDSHKKIKAVPQLFAGDRHKANYPPD
ncbi:MAG: hypothetical protein DWQ05_05765 [Calditrichaeota bacterium]|nr:MAG: hypothetical protein DWQ05_05765 [Calditrichota bacterium]